MEESGKIWDFRSFNYNTYWLLLNMYLEKILDLDQEVFVIRVTFSDRMKRVLKVFKPGDLSL